LNKDFTAKTAKKNKNQLTAKAPRRQENKNKNKFKSKPEGCEGAAPKVAFRIRFRS
jgi:hypothetical protein